jgi:nitrogen fixation NifU-like protein
VREGRIADVRYRTFGCAVALASSSMASDLAIGQTLAAAAAITDEALAEALGGLPEGKRHCTVLAVGALRLALEDYLARHPEAYCAQGCPCAQPC